MNSKRIRRDRRGAAAVEFAIVAPVLFAFVFGLFELSRLMMFSGNINTAMLVGAREATLTDSSASEVDSLIRAELKRFGITNAEIQFTPSDFSSTDEQVTIDIGVPIGESTGMHFSRITLNDTKFSKSITVDRETQ